MSEKQEGDFITAYDTEKKTSTQAKISKIRRSFTTAFTRLWIAGSVLSVTPAHALQTEAGEWRAAGQLQQGDYVRSIKGIVRLDSTYTEAVTPTPVISYELEGGLDYVVGEMPVVVSSKCDLRTITEELTPTEWQFVRGEIKKLATTAERSTFIADLARNDDALRNFLKTQDGIDAWKSIYKARSGKGLLQVESAVFVQTISNLQKDAKLAQFMQMPTIQAKFASVDDILERFISLEKTVGAGVAREYLVYFQSFVTKYATNASITNRDKFILEMLQSENKFKSGTFSLKILQEQNNIPTLAGLQLKGFELEILPTNAQYSNFMDMLFENADGIPFLVEIKNYSNTLWVSKLDVNVVNYLRNQAQFIKQLEAYLLNVDNLDRMAYFFKNRPQMNITKVKEEFQAIFQSKADVWFGSSTPQLTTKFKLLFQVQDKAEFLQKVNNLNNPIYDFINMF